MYINFFFTYIKLFSVYCSAQSADDLDNLAISKVLSSKSLKVTVGAILPMSATVFRMTRLLIGFLLGQYSLIGLRAVWILWHWVLIPGLLNYRRFTKQTLNSPNLYCASKEVSIYFVPKLILECEVCSVLGVRRGTFYWPILHRNGGLNL